jgi:hypothetical protein
MADDPAEVIQLFKSARKDDAAEGLRLVKAFMQIRDPVLRDAIVAFAERMARSASPRNQSESS